VVVSRRLIWQPLYQNEPDLLIEPKTGDIDLLEFYRGAEIMTRGYEEASRVLPKFLWNR
jgi:predicted acylesterase/phospholipase RssA